MKVSLVTNQQEYEDGHPDPANMPFLQAWDYGNFLQRAGREVWRVAVDGPEPHRIQGIIHRRRFGLDSVYIPRATVGRAALLSVLDFFTEEGMTFCHLEANNDVPDIPHQCYGAKNVQAEHLWVLPVHHDAETLLENMHAKTRYNIRLAERKGVHIREGVDVDTFFSLESVTTARNNFESHEKTYYTHLATLDRIHQITAYYEGVPVAAALQLKQGRRLIYLYGASANVHRNVMAPYLVQWASIQLAKRLGCTEYDFLGVAPKRADGEGRTSTHHGYTWDADHEFSGVTRFKAGFGGIVQSFPKAKIIVLNPIKYALHTMIEKMKRTAQRFRK